MSLILVIAGLALGAHARVVPLLVPCAGGRLAAAPEGLALLRERYGATPVSLATFIGRARSGKSFGLNVLLGVPHAEGFAVGHTFEPETAGAQLWSEPLVAATAAAAGGMLQPHNHTTLVIDTEGLGTGAELRDRALLAVTAVISSRLVYHLMGYFYTEDVLRLHGLACLVEDFRRRGILDEVALPKITWVVHKNELQRGARATPADVLFGLPLAERPNPDSNPQLAQFNATVRAVRECFTDHLVHLVPTATPTAGLEGRLLTRLAHDALTPAYVAEMRLLAEELTAERAAEPRTGADIAALIELVLPAANEGAEQVVDRVANAVARRRVDLAKAAVVDAVARQVAYPQEDAALARALDALDAAVVRAYRGDDAGDTPVASPLRALLERFEPELREKIAAERLRAQMLNADASEATCAAAAAAAATHFARATLTADGAAVLKLTAFDAAVAAAADEYERTAVGPRRAFHATQLATQARAAREAAVAETAPMVRQVWLFLGLAFAGAFFVVGRAARLFGATLEPMCAVLEMAQVGALFVAALAGASMFGYEPLGPFDRVVDALTGLYAWGSAQRAVLVGTAGALLLSVLLLRCCVGVCKKTKH